MNYIQKGHLFAKPSALDDPQSFITTFLDGLKDSLALTLVNLSPLAGHHATKERIHPLTQSLLTSTNSSGDKFIHTAADTKLSDIPSLIHVTSVVQSYFDHDRLLNHDAHTMSLSLLSIQVTACGCHLYMMFAKHTTCLMAPLLAIPNRLV